MVKEIGSENVITHEDFLATSRRVHYNRFIAEYYDRFAEEQKMPIELRDGEIVYGKDEKFLDRARGMRECGKHWQFDHYETSKYKNLIRVNRCRDRFCLNCMALEADQRYAQYAKVLDGFLFEYDLYHVVLTVPNVSEEWLRNTVTLILDRFSYMLRFFDGRKGIRNLDLKKYGYIGAVRSLEITVSKKNGSYHPHLHCIFILKKDLDLSPVYWNRFSEDRSGRKETRLFSEFEMILQRLWCLLILKKDATKYNIEHIEEVCDYPDGFSCYAEKANGDYHEIFKYVIKGTFEEETLFKYETFRTLYDALFGRRAYETFGVLRRYDFNDVDGDLGLTTPDEAFDRFIASLKLRELPKRIEEILGDIINAYNRGTEEKYISKAVFVRHFKTLTEEEKVRYLKELSKEMEKRKE